MAWTNGERLSNNIKPVDTLWQKLTTWKDAEIEGQLKDTLSCSEKKKEVVMEQKTIDNIKWIENLSKRKRAILDYLKENCMMPKKWEEIEHVERYWVMWVTYCLTLPSVNWSKCKIIDWFESDDVVSRYDYDKNQTWMDNSITIDDVATKLYWNMRDFLSMFGVSQDTGVDFVKELFKYYVDDCSTWNSLKSVARLKNSYFLKDRNENIKDDNWTPACAGRRCAYWHCDFNWVNSGVNVGHLFMWLNVKEIE